jgi:hypothetical protein
MTYVNKRQKRFKADVTGLYGKMILAKKVEIIDMSLTGVALRTDRQLNIGREYPLRLVWKEKTLDVWGVVVRSEKLEIEGRDGGKDVSLYSSGVMFKDASSEAIADFIRSVEWDKKESVSVTVDSAPNVGFGAAVPA